MGGTDTVLAVNSYVTSYNCSGVASFRVDTRRFGVDQQFLGK
jgi:hypothetical protein